MVSRELEFRGINSEHLRMYFEELGGKQTEENNRDIFEGPNWSGEFLHEGEITFTPAFKVNTVHIRFSAESENDLNELIKKYRYKTTRIGG